MAENLVAKYPIFIKDAGEMFDQLSSSKNPQRLNFL
jgi:hypothetical protein